MRGSGPEPEVLLVGRCKLDRANPVANKVYERLLTGPDDPNYLGEVSVFFDFDPASVYDGPDGERVIPRARLLSVAVVRAGAQRTRITDVKDRKGGGTASDSDAALRDRLLRAQLDALKDGPVEMAEPATGIALREHPGSCSRTRASMN